MKLCSFSSQRKFTEKNFKNYKCRFVIFVIAKLKNHSASWFHQRAVKIFEWNGIPSVSDNHCAFCDKGFSHPSKLSQHLIRDKNHKLLVDAFQRSIQNQQHARAPSPPVRAPQTLSRGYGIRGILVSLLSHGRP